MNELALSNDLNVITAEINSYKQVAGQAIFEIGKRLKHVKENELAHGEFGEWLNKIDLSLYQASRFIKVYSELGDSKLLTSANLGFRNLLEIATMPEEQRDKPHEIESTGETKTPNDMTVKELQEVKAALRKSETEKDKANQEKYHYQKLVTSLQNQPPKVVTQTVEVTPKGLQKKIEDLELNNFHLKSGYEKAKEKLKQYQLRSPEDYNQEQSERLKKKLQDEADITTMNMRIAYKNFIEQGAISTYIQGAIAHASTAEKKHLNEMVEMAEKVIHDTKLALNGRKLGVVNE